MPVFVLNAGRSGSTTFAAACSHISNYTSGHETKKRVVTPDRLNFPQRHIEVDARLAWFLGGLAARYDGDRAVRYVHLVRDRELVAKSYLRRFRYHPPRRRGRIVQALTGERIFPGGLIEGFAHGICGQPAGLSRQARLEICYHYVDTVTSNIRQFLATRPHITVTVENAQRDFAQFLDWIEAEGDRAAALAEWHIRHGTSQPHGE